jgi:hypothetical protein
MLPPARRRGKLKIITSLSKSEVQAEAKNWSPCVPLDTIRSMHPITRHSNNSIKSKLEQFEFGGYLASLIRLELLGTPGCRFESTTFCDPPVFSHPLNQIPSETLSAINGRPDKLV